MNVVGELAVAAGIEPPRVLLYDDGPPNALVFGRDHDHATVVVGRAPAGRARPRGDAGRHRAGHRIGGRRRSRSGRRHRGGLRHVRPGHDEPGRDREPEGPGALAGGGRAARRTPRDPRSDAAGIAALLGLLAEDDDTPSNAAGGCLSLLTMGGIIGVGVAFINLFLSGPLLTLRLAAARLPRRCDVRST